MKVTLRDIAQKTGVSVNTVSHALSDKPDISKATKARIIAVAEELGYVRNSVADALRSGKSRTVGVILPDIGNPNFAIMLRGIEAFFRTAGYTVFVMNSEESAKEEATAITTMLGKDPDGIILCPATNDAANIRRLTRSGVPFVLIGRYVPGVHADYVVCDDEEGGYLAMRNLLEAGHRKIAFFNGDCRITGGVQRLAGARRALRERGMELPPSHILTLSFRKGDNRRLICDFFTAHQDVTGLIAFSDLLAYESISALESLGRRVPDEISVVGFDNICSDYDYPYALSSVSVRKKTMANAAAELLLRKMEHKSEGETHIVLPTALVSRATVVPPPPETPVEL